MKELSVKGDGVIWLGEDDDKIVVIHLRKDTIVMRGEALEEWV